MTRFNEHYEGECPVCGLPYTKKHVSEQGKDEHKVGDHATGCISQLSGDKIEVHVHEKR